MSLSPSELRSRRAFDDEVIRSMLPSPILQIEGYKTIEDVSAGRTATAQEGAAGKILYYGAWYRFPILIGPGETTDHAVAVFNADVHDFPFTGSIAYVVSKPLPWSPHVHPGNGLICQGESWSRSRGKMLLAHAIVHVARLLNCDEQNRDPSYSGYNSEAIMYWRQTMRCQPLTPGLKYPVPSAEVTHGVSLSQPVQQFRLLGDDPDASNDSGFRLVTHQDDGFQLVGGL